MYIFGSQYHMSLYSHHLPNLQFITPINLSGTNAQIIHPAFRTNIEVHHQINRSGGNWHIMCILVYEARTSTMCILAYKVYPIA